METTQPMHPWAAIACFVKVVLFSTEDTCNSDILLFGCLRKTEEGRENIPLKCWQDHTFAGSLGKSLKKNLELLGTCRTLTKLWSSTKNYPVFGNNIDNIFFAITPLGNINCGEWKLTRFLRIKKNGNTISPPPNSS